MPEAKVYTLDQLRVGLTEEFEREVTEEDILAFARNSGDWNPLHVDAEYARGSNYRDRIAHGAFQVGLASAMLGMYLPGRSVLLGSVNARFPAPLYFPATVLVRGEITAWNPQNRGGSLKVTVMAGSARTPVAEILMGFTLHSDQQSAVSSQRSAVSGQGLSPLHPFTPSPLHDSRLTTHDSRLALLVTGAAGGIGTALVSALAGEYTIFGAVNRKPLEAPLREREGVREIPLDFAAPDWEERLEAALGERPLFGVLHAAWPGSPHGGLLQTQDDVLEQQIAFGTTHTVRLARLLFARAGEEGGRFIALGSLYGSHRPQLNMAAYSLGKAALEDTVKLLAPELARRRITINAVCPSFVPVGLNRQTDERQQKIEAARVPMGRVCSPDDIVGMTRYLLSPEAAFLSGQSVGLYGGQL
jgi:NAD(P)-dependent dehydrogenase (short-subunit alcohol dehydrogenase family)/acyl dehydratase